MSIRPGFNINTLTAGSFRLVYIRGTSEVINLLLGNPFWSPYELHVPVARKSMVNILRELQRW